MSKLLIFWTQHKRIFRWRTNFRFALFANLTVVFSFNSEFCHVFQIREDVKAGIYVDCLTEEYVYTMNDVIRLLMKVH